MSFIHRVRFAIISLLLCGTSATFAAEVQISPQQQRIRERYEKALVANPRASIAFERLFQSYFDAEGPDAWLTHLREQAKNDPQESAYPLIEGLILERIGRDADAIEAYRDAIQIAPEDWRGVAAIGKLQHRIKQFEYAVPNLRKAIDLNPPRQELQNLLKTLGRSYAAMADEQNATKAWLELAERFPDDASTILDLADLLVEEGQVDEAVKQFENLQKISQDRYVKVRAALSQAQLLSQQGKGDDAVALLRRLLGDLAPDSWLRGEARRMVERILREKGKDEPVIEFYEAWLVERPDDLEMSIALAQFHRRSGRTDESEKIFKQVISRAGTRKDARQGLAELYLEQGQFEKAAAAYEALCELSPDDAKAWERLGQIHLSNLQTSETERNEAAAKAWRNIYSRKADDSTRAVLAAEIFRANRMVEETIAHYRKAVEVAPANTVHYEYLGEYLVELDRREEALLELRKITADGRDNSANWTRLSEVLARFEYVEESLAAIEKAIGMVSSNSEKFYLESMRSAVFINADRFDEAAGSIESLQALALSAEQKHDVRMATVELYSQSGELQQRIAQWVEAARNADDFQLLALLQRAHSNKEGALAAISRAIELAADDPIVLNTAVEIFKEAGDRSGAIDLLKKLIALQPQNQVTHLEQIAELYRDLGDWEAAITAANQLIDLTPESDVGYLLAGDLMLRSGQVEEAITTLRKGVRRNPREVTLLTVLAQRLVDDGRLPEAIDRYWRAYDAATEEPEKLRMARELAKLYIASGQLQRLVDRFNELAYDDDAQAATMSLAVAYEQANQPDEAQKVLERWLRTNPSNPDVIDRLMTLAKDQGDTEQALLYAERLLPYRREDSRFLRTFGELLYEQDRVDEAISQWRAAGRVRNVNADVTDQAMLLADTLAKYNLGEEALNTLNDATRRFPDAWNVAYNLAIYTKNGGDDAKAAELFDRFIERQMPEAPHANGARHFSYLGSGTGPIELRQWMNLPRMMQSALQENSVNQIYQLRSSLAISGTSVSPGPSSYHAPDFHSAHLAALIHRMHLAEKDDSLDTFIGALAARAGYTFAEDGAFKDVKAADTSLRPTKFDRMLLLRAMMLLRQTRESYLAVQNFLQEQPDDLDYKTLQAYCATQLSSQTNPQGEPWVSRQQVDEVLRDLSERSPEITGYMLSSHIGVLLQSGEEEQGLKWSRWLIENEQVASEARLTAMYQLVALNQAEVLEGFRESLSGVIATYMEEGFRKRQPGYLVPQMVMVALQNSQLEFAVDVFGEYVSVLGKQHRPQTGAGTTPIFSLNSANKVQLINSAIVINGTMVMNDEMASSFLLDANVLSVLQQLYHTLLPNEKLSLLMDRITEDLKDAEGGHQSLLTGSLIALHELAEQPNEALALIEKQYGGQVSDKLRLVVGSLHAKAGEHQKAFDELLRVRATFGSVAKQAAIGRLQMAAHLKDVEAQKTAAIQLARANLPQAEAVVLAGTLNSLGLTKQGAMLMQRAAPNSRASTSSTAILQARRLAVGSSSTNQTSATARRLLDAVNEKDKEKVLNLATKVIEEESRNVVVDASNPSLNIAIRALREWLATADLIKQLKERVSSNERDVSAISQLVAIYATLRSQKDADEWVEKLFQVSPNGTMLRLAYAEQLSRTRNHSKAQKHYEIIATEAPELLIYASYFVLSYQQSGDWESLVEFIERIPAVSQSSSTKISMQSAMMQGQNRTSWIENAANNIAQNNKPELAVRVYRKLRQIDPNRAKDPVFSTWIAMLLLQEGSSEQAMKELQNVIAPISNPNDVRHTTLATQLFFPGARMGGGMTFYMDDTYRPTLADELIKAMRKAGKLDEFVSLIERGNENEPWRRSIGLPLQAMIGMNSEPVDLAPVKELAESLVASKSTQGIQAYTHAQWAMSVTRAIAEKLNEMKDDSGVGAAIADRGLEMFNVQGNPLMSMGQSLIYSAPLYMAAAKSYTLQGEKEKAGEAILRFLEAKDGRVMAMAGAQAAQMAAILAQQEMQYKQPYFKAIVDAGHGEILLDYMLDTLAATESTVAGAFPAPGGRLPNARLLGSSRIRGPQLMQQQFRTVIDNSEMRKLIATKAKEMHVQSESWDEEQFKENAPKLLTLYELNRDTTRASQIRERMMEGKLITPEQKAMFAVEKFEQAVAGNDMDLARKLLVEVMEAGHVGMIPSATVSRWHNVFEDPATMEKVANAIKGLTIDPKLVEGNVFWVMQLTQAVHVQLVRNFEKHSRADQQRIVNAARDVYKFANAMAPYLNYTSNNRRPSFVGQELTLLIAMEDYETIYKQLTTLMFQPTPQTQGLLPLEAMFDRVNPLVLRFNAGEDLAGVEQEKKTSNSGQSGQTILAALLQAANETGKAEELKKTIQQRSDADANLRAVGVRMLAILAMLEKDYDEFAVQFEKISEVPLFLQGSGADPTLFYLLEETAKDENLAKYNTTLLRQVLDSPALSTSHLSIIGQYGVNILGAAFAESELREHVAPLLLHWYEARAANRDMNSRARTMSGLLRLAAAAARKSNNHQAATDYLRATLRLDTPNPEHFSGDDIGNQVSIALHEQLVKMKENKSLEAYTQQAAREWESWGKQSAAGRRLNIEPAITLAACYVLLGQPEKASGILSAVGENAYPVGMPVLVRAMLTVEGTEQSYGPMVDVLVDWWVRWPAFADVDALWEGQLPIAALCKKYNRAIPIDQRLEDALKAFHEVSTQSNLEAAHAHEALSEFDGSPKMRGVRTPDIANIIGVMRQKLPNVMIQLANIEGLESADKLDEWAFKYSSDAAAGYRWLERLRASNPAEAYEWMKKMVGMEPDREYFVRGSQMLSMQSPASAKPNANGKVQRGSLAQSYVLLAIEQGKLDELTAYCEDIIENTTADRQSVSPQKLDRKSALQLRMFAYLHSDKEKFRNEFAEYSGSTGAYKPASTSLFQGNYINIGVDPFVVSLLGQLEQDEKWKDEIGFILPLWVTAMKKFYHDALEYGASNASILFPPTEPWHRILRFAAEQGDNETFAKYSKDLIELHVQRSKSNNGQNYSGSPESDLSQMLGLIHAHKLAETQVSQINTLVLTHPRAKELTAFIQTFMKRYEKKTDDAAPQPSTESTPEPNGEPTDDQP